jgi:hypothetical protein
MESGNRNVGTGTNNTAAASTGTNNTAAANYTGH